MAFVGLRAGLISAATLVLVGACSNNAAPSRPASGAAGNAAQGSAGNTGAPGTAGSTASGTGGDTTSGAGGVSSGTGGAGSGSAGSGAGTAGVAGSSGSSGAAGSGGAPGTAGSGGATGTAGAGGTGATRPINVMPGANFSATFNGQPMYLNKSKPALGKLVLFLPGIGNQPGSGGIDAFVKEYGAHIFMPATQTNLTGSNVPGMYKGMNTPEANRQVGDARTDLWDGKGRVNWNTVASGKSMLEETLAAIAYGMEHDPGGDWGYFLNADGTLRTTDVWVVGYSWGSQTWAMISTYIPFGRVVCTSGPVDEGWPNATWMTDTSATPLDSKYVLVGQDNPYPQQMEEIFANVIKAKWPGMVVNVTPNGMPASYTSDQHLFAMIGGNGGISPGGHTVFCNDNPANGWIPLCKYVFGQQ